MQCSELGPFWTKKFTRELQKRRDAAAEMAGRCKPDGDYRKQIELAVRQMDMALAASDLLAALLAMLEYTASLNANQGFGDEDDHEAVKLAAAAVLKANGGGAS